MSVRDILLTFLLTGLGLIENSGQEKQDCAFCANSGWVVYDTGDPLGEAWEQWRREVNGIPLAERRRRGLDREIYGEALAPCPHCEQGKSNEYPTKTHDGRPGYLLTPWGSQGFWRGKATGDLRPVDTGSRVLSKAENARRMRELERRLGFGEDAGLDLVTEIVRELDERPAGKCDDCQEDTIHAPRFQYGRFALCRACVLPRARAKAGVRQVVAA